MPTKQINEFPAVVTPAGPDLLVTQQDADSVTRKMTVIQTVQAVDPKAHKALHQNGGADEISVVGLSGLLADAQTAVAHALGSAIHNADTLAAISALISDGTIILASQAEAEAGTEATKRMTPLRVAQAFAALSVLPRSYLAGFKLSNGTDTTNDIDIAVGSARNSVDDGNLNLAAAVGKQIDVTWAAGGTPGTPTGGLSSSLTLTNDTWYHVHLILVSGTVEVGFDTSVVAANLITDHSATKFRRIGSVRRGTATNLLFTQIGDEFLWNTVPALLVDTGTPGTTAVTLVVTVPTGVQVLAHLNVFMVNQAVYISSTSMTDQAASLTAAPLGSMMTGGGQVDVLTDTSAQVRYRVSANDTLRITTYGWKDRRGKDD